MARGAGGQQKARGQPDDAIVGGDGRQVQLGAVDKEAAVGEARDEEGRALERVVHVAGQEGNWRDYLVDMGRKDVLIVFDIRRYQSDLARLSVAAANLGVTIVLVTDSWLSPIASVATHVLPARVSVPSPWDSSAALMVIAETLIAGVTAADPERSKRRISMLEVYRDDDDPKRRSGRTGEVPPKDLADPQA